MGNLLLFQILLAFTSSKLNERGFMAFEATFNNLFRYIVAISFVGV